MKVEIFIEPYVKQPEDFGHYQEVINGWLKENKIYKDNIVEIKTTGNAVYIFYIEGGYCL